MTAPVAVGYRLIEKPSRIYAVDMNDIEICGARQPYGHDHWIVHPTVRLGAPMHQVIAPTRSAAIAHVEMIAHWFTRSVS